MGGFKFMCCTSPQVDEGQYYQRPVPPPSNWPKPPPPSPPLPFPSATVPGYPDNASGAPAPDVPNQITHPSTPVPSEEGTRLQQNVQWVVGLDFGTTFSGFAYARAAGEERISTFYDWPSRGPTSPYCKTLTGIFYKQTAQGEFQCQSWGHLAYSDIVADSRSATPSGLYLSRFKLLLKRDLDDPILASSIPPPLTVDTVITDYLRHIGELALQVMRNHEGDARFKREAVHWCVTVPAIWDEASKQRMKACMVSAGLVSAEMGGIAAVSVVLEPEAASFHCHQVLQRDMRDACALHMNDRILVADVGGGTVDIVVQEILGTGSDYRVRELTESSGGLCGGTFVDGSFLRFLSRKVECFDEFLRSGVPSYRSRLLSDWEKIKCQFGQPGVDPNATVEIELHRDLAAMWEAHDKAHSLPARPSGYRDIELTQEDLRTIFDPVVDEIIELIAAQLLHVQGIKVMFVVGGFAGSPYLLQRIKARFSSEVQHIVSPLNPGSAIIQGAVSLARNPNAYDVSRISRKTYGTSITLRDFRPRVDPAHLLKVDNDGTKWCRNRFDMFVRRGDRVEVNQVVTKEYVPHSENQTVMQFDLYSSDDKEPRYTEGPNVTKEGGFSVALPRNYSRQNLPLFKFSIYFGRSSIELKVEAQFQHAHGEKVRTLQLPVTYQR